MSLNRCVAIFACLVWLFGLPGCGTGTHDRSAHATTEGMLSKGVPSEGVPSEDTPSKEEVISAQPGETRLRTGQVLAIELDSNASTGYGWDLIDDGSPQLRPAPVPATTDMLPTPMPGAGGISRWRFHAVQPGTTTLRLVYRRAWEKEVAPVRTAIYRVVVE